jgi:hypothetical protein
VTVAAESPPIEGVTAFNKPTFLNCLGHSGCLQFFSSSISSYLVVSYALSLPQKEACICFQKYNLTPSRPPLIRASSATTANTDHQLVYKGIFLCKTHPNYIRTTGRPRQRQARVFLLPRFGCRRKQMLATGALARVTQTRERLGHAKHVKPGKQGVFDHNNL